MRVLTVLLICVGLAGACAKKPAAPSSPDVWAVVDGVEIHRDAVERAYRSATPANATPSAEEVWTAKLGILNEMVIKQILAQRAKSLGIDVTEDELAKAVAERKGTMSDEAYQRELSQRNLTADDLRAGMRLELIAQKMIDRDVTSKIAVTDQEVSDFFNANRAQFNVPEPTYHVAQIVVTPIRDAQITNRQNDDATTPEAASRKADMLMERLRGGAAFAELAQDYSEDPRSAPQGGDLGFISQSDLQQASPVLRDVVLKSEPGTVKVVSAGGAHTLVMVVAREPAGQRDLTMPGVRENITATLHDRKLQVLRTAYLTAARNDATVVDYLAKQIVASPGVLPSMAPSAPGK
jgi:peptidyl-prolyl cis-trans isomerase SurA